MYTQIKIDNSTHKVSRNGWGGLDMVGMKNFHILKEGEESIVLNRKNDFNNTFISELDSNSEKNVFVKTIQRRIVPKKKNETNEIEPKVMIQNVIDRQRFIPKPKIKQSANVSALISRYSKQTITENNPNDIVVKKVESIKIERTEKKVEQKQNEKKDIKVLLCGIAKMENNYLKEWVLHYKDLGFDNICLYDNNDIDGEHFEDVIKEEIDNGFVIVENARSFYRYQIKAYDECYDKYKNQYDWIAFFDIDEFLFLDEQYNNNIKNFVNSNIFNCFNCIRVCWENYDDNGLIKIENDDYNCKSRFTHPINGDNQSKAIVRTTIEKLWNNSPHIMSTRTRFASCNTEGRRCSNNISIRTATTLKNAKLKHYRFKTIEEFVMNKMVRLWPTNYGNGGKDMLNLDFFFKLNKRTPEKEKYAKELIEKKKKDTLTIKSWVDTSVKPFKKRNWGDELNYHMLKELTDKTINLVGLDSMYGYMCIGSIIDKSFASPKNIIWGSGAPSYNSVINTKPSRVCAVRGPLTRKKLLAYKIDCPEVYGDPALLLPYIYKNESIEKKYEYGIIPHFTNINDNVLNEWRNNDKCLIIDLSKYDKWTDVIDEILSCKVIISESLHGLIVAEAYNIPNVWMKINDNPRKNKGNFKFHDFFLSIGKEIENPYLFNKNVTIEILNEWASKYEHINTLDINKLIENCPFDIKLKEEKEIVA